MRQRVRSHLTHANVAAALVSLALILALAVVGVVVLGGGKAAAVQQLSCGDTITTDTTLHHNLVNCPNHGIVIGADDVTLDLNYHTIDGDGTPAAGCDRNTEFCDVGVLNRGHDGVAVAHGSVRQFLVGVWGLRASHNRLLDISSSGNECCGLGFFRGTRSLVRNSSGNGGGDNGMFLIASHHVRVLHNSFRHNRDLGIFVGVKDKGFKSTHNLIKGNLFSHNRFYGIVLESSAHTRVRRNRSVRDGTGVIVALRAHRNVIARNRIVHPTDARGGDGQGIEVPRGAHNVIARNSIRDTSQNAIAVGGFGFAAQGVGNVVRRNQIRGAGEDGVKVGEATERTLLRGNRVRRSRDDGLDVNNPKTKLTRNDARRNGDLGIEAVRGVIDGGGNKASGNGDLRQCTNIVCR
jgi:parallel beta-helix repeat protein